MGITSDPNDPAIVRDRLKTSPGQNEKYLVLPEEARKEQGFVRPYRDAYIHNTCGSLTTMGVALSETYARNPKFYGSTFCVKCNNHFPVNEFKWTDGEVVGS